MSEFKALGNLFGLLRLRQFGSTRCYHSSFQNLSSTETETVVSIPPKPKRPMTAYFRYMTEVRPDLVKKNPQLKNQELVKVIGKQWSSLDSAIQEKYTAGFKNDMVAYNVVLDKYHKSLTPEQKEAQEQVKLTKQQRKERLDKRRRILELGRPKKPPSPFLQFLQTKSSPGDGMKHHTEMAKEFGPIWKDRMTTKQKETFVVKYSKQMETYEKDLFTWEIDMMKRGNDDLIRSKTLHKVQDSIRAEAASRTSRK